MREFLKERYDFEISHKDSLNNSLNTSLTVLVVIGSALVFLISSWQWPCNIFIWLSLIPGVGSAYFIIRSVLYLLRTFRGYEYRLLPNANSLLEHKKKLEEYANKYVGQVPTAEKLFEDYLIPLLSDAATKNQESNAQKSNCLAAANKRLVYAACLCAISAIPFFLDRITHKENVQKVEVVSPIQIAPMPPENQTPPAAQPPPASPPPQQAPPPQAPTNQNVAPPSPPSGPTNHSIQASHAPPPPQGPSNQIIIEGVEI